MDNQYQKKRQYRLYKALSKKYDEDCNHHEYRNAEKYERITGRDYDTGIKIRGEI